MRTPKFRFEIMIMAAGFIGAGLLLGGCASYKEESGTKTEYNSTTGRFETSRYASVGGTLWGGSEKRSTPVSEKDLKK